MLARVLTWFESATTSRTLRSNSGGGGLKSLMATPRRRRTFSLVAAEINVLEERRVMTDPPTPFKSFIDARITERVTEQTSFMTDWTNEIKSVADSVRAQASSLNGTMPEVTADDLKNPFYSLAANYANNNAQMVSSAMGTPGVSATFEYGGMVGSNPDEGDENTWHFSNTTPGFSTDAWVYESGDWTADLSYNKTIPAGSGTRTMSGRAIANSITGLDYLTYSDIERDASQNVVKRYAFEIDTTNSTQWFRYATNSAGVSFGAGFDRFNADLNGPDYSAYAGLGITSPTLNALFGASYLDGEGKTLTGSIEHVVATGSGETWLVLKFESNPLGDFGTAGAKYTNGSNDFRVLATYNNPVNGATYVLVSTSWALTMQTPTWSGQWYTNGSTGESIDEFGDKSFFIQTGVSYSLGRGTQFWKSLSIGVGLQIHNRDKWEQQLDAFIDYSW